MMSQLDELLSINKMLVEDQPQYRRDSGSLFVTGAYGYECR